MKRKSLVFVPKHRGKNKREKGREETMIKQILSSKSQQIHTHKEVGTKRREKVVVINMLALEAVQVSWARISQNLKTGVISYHM